MDKKLKDGSILSGALSLTVSGLIVKLLGLIYKVPLSYVLSDVGMGYFNSAYTVYTLFYIVCTAGVPKAISILTAEAEGEGDRALVNDIYRTSFSIFFCGGLLFSGIFLFGAGFISDVIGNRGSYLTMLAIAPSIVFVCASGVLRGYFSGTLNFVPIAVSELISGCFRAFLGLGLAYIAAHFGASYAVISAVTILGTTLGSFFGFLYLVFNKKRHNNVVISRQKVKNRFAAKQIMKRVLRIAIPLTLTSAIASLASIVDLAIIMRRLGGLGYGEYLSGVLYGNYTTLAIPILNLIVTVISPLSAVMLPIVSKTEVKANKKRLSDVVSAVMEVVSIIAIPASMFLLFESREVLAVIFEDSSASLAAPMLQLLAPGMVFMCVATVLNTALEGMGKPKVPLISLIIGLAVKLTVSYVLIGNESYGVLGAPIGSSISYFVSATVVALYLTFHDGVKLKGGGKVILIMISSSLAMAVYLFLRERLITTQNPLISLTFMVFFGLVYIAFLFSFGILRAKNLKKMAKYTKSSA